MRIPFGLLLCTSVGLTACSEVEPPISKELLRPAKIFEVVGHSGVDVREFPGVVAAAEVSTLSFRVTGEIVELAVGDGDKVKQGQVIARLDARSAENEVKNAQAEFQLAASENDRKKSLFNKGIISRSSYDRAYTTYVSARTNLETARDNLSYTVIRAPFSGVIGKVSVDNHEVVQAKQTVATVQGEKAIEVTIQMPESIVANTRPAPEIGGYKPLVVFASMPERSYETSYKENAAEANLGSQTYDVTFTLDRPDDLTLLPGMSATMRIDIARITRITESDRFVIPTAAVGRVDGVADSYVWQITEDSIVQKKAVTLGKVTDEGVEVLSGIAVGDRLVAAGLSELTDGMKVKPLAQERGI